MNGEGGQILSQLQTLKDELLKKATFHQRMRSWDAAWHQTLVIVAALSSIASGVAGLYFAKPGLAGVFGTVPAAATLLIQTLQCVRAQNWHLRMATGIEAIRRKLEFEVGDPTSADVANASKELTALEALMAADWSKKTDEQHIDLQIRRPRKA
jgi:hypothetical protein